MSISDSFDRVFKALAAPARRQILDDLRDQPLTTGALCAHFPELDRCTVMQHIKVLEDAGLIVAVKRGRERWNHLNAVPIQQIHERWIGPHAERAAAMLTRLKEDLEP
ncbi:putative ArsR family transcriptional regulator [Sphingomonas changbaiensis NBRC 104936]|uniref:Putative ArsR family transcriptional regulator n=1 Tax=Sphingomonas changbaiensis NBRC 104936 TaxID=1219043 RepID=A0A0E9MPP7_9SPHN|nr:helix-turn-helix domain-containing protein [Sphingomonas changbaiensis]GAO39519.1 putative ArsR family transcriptional regulator [Sphingomonas changbaiensis NBRC 104936]